MRVLRAPTVSGCCAEDADFRLPGQGVFTARGTFPRGRIIPVLRRLRAPPLPEIRPRSILSTRLPSLPAYLNEVESRPRLEGDVLVLLLVLHVLLHPLLLVDPTLLHQVEESSGRHGHGDGVLGLGLPSERRVAPAPPDPAP